MNLDYKKVLYIDVITKDYEYKIHEDLIGYLGGIGVGYKLLLDNINRNPVVLVNGPLSGKFPYASKSVLMSICNNKVKEMYGGGTIHALMGFAGIDAIVFLDSKGDAFNLNVKISQQEVCIEEASNVLADNKNIDFYLSKNNVSSENYFSFGDISKDFLNVSYKVRLSIDYSNTISLVNYYDYDKVYTDILGRFKELSVEPRNNPSCFGCPMGCDNSAKGEDDLNVAVLPRCLVACGYAESIYKEIPLVYACLSSLGFKYMHSDLENISELVGKIKTRINALLAIQ